MNLTKTPNSAYQSILQLIFDNELKPNQLVTESALSEKLSISRTPIREALIQLEVDGLIYNQNGRRRVYVLSMKEVAEIFDTKIVLEGAVVRWAAEACDDNTKSILLESLANMKSALDFIPETPEEREQRLKNGWRPMPNYMPPFFNWQII